MSDISNRFKQVISHAKEYGFIFQSSEIYDGLSAVYDYGPNGVELKNNIKELGSKMIKKGVKIGRPFPPFYDWCRISTGTIPEVERFIKGMKELYS